MVLETGVTRYLSPSRGENRDKGVPGLSSPTLMKHHVKIQHLSILD